MSEHTEREAMQALMRDLSRQGEPGLVSTFCPKHNVITGSRLVAVTPLDRYAFERFDYGKPGDPKLIRAEVSRSGCPQCEAEGFKGLAEHDPRSPGAQKYNFVPQSREDHDMVEMSEREADVDLFNADRLLKNVKAGSSTRVCSEALDHLMNAALGGGMATADAAYVVPTGLEKHMESSLRTFKKKCLVKRKK